MARGVDTRMLTSTGGEIRDCVDVSATPDQYRFRKFLRDAVSSSQATVSVLEMKELFLRR